MDGSVLLNPEPVDYVRASTLILNFQDQAITLFDAVVATMSERLRSAVWTFDRDFELMGVKRWG
jgi:predicted nucleic acid-binding protein